MDEITKTKLLTAADARVENCERLAKDGLSGAVEEHSTPAYWEARLHEARTARWLIQDALGMNPPSEISCAEVA